MRVLSVPGSRMWSVIAVLVAYHEIVCLEGELLSEVVDRALEKHPVAVRAFILITAAHLINWLPKKLDPYYGLAVITKKGKYDHH